MSPPSTGITVPEMNDARSEAEEARQFGDLFGLTRSAQRCSVVEHGHLLGAFGPPDCAVTIRPGQIVFARMPLRPYSTAACFVIMITPAFDAP